MTIQSWKRYRKRKVSVESKRVPEKKETDTVRVGKKEEGTLESGFYIWFHNSPSL